MFDSFAWHAATQRTLSSIMQRLGRDRFSRDDFTITPLPVTVPGLDPAFEGYRIVQVSDIHLGHWVSPERLNGIIDLINEQEPDLAVNTGDFVSYVMEDLAPDLTAAMQRIASKDGSLAVLGNHDHWTDPDRVTEILSAGNVIVLRNDVYSVRRDGAELHIGGTSVSITPDQPVSLAGQMHTRIARTVESEVTATALALESRDGDQSLEQAILVSCDLVCIRGGLLEAVRQRLTGRLADVDVN